MENKIETITVDGVVYDVTDKDLTEKVAAIESTIGDISSLLDELNS